MKKIDNTFDASLRIKSKIVIERLFDRNSGSNKSFLVYPIKCIFEVADAVVDNLECPRVVISVSSKKFKRAVDRNLIKRRIREAFRQNKHFFDKNINLALIYIAKEIEEYAVIEKSMKKIFNKLQSPHETT